MKQSRRIKKPESVPKLMLEEVIGLTTKNANGLASTGSNSKCAYIAGCVVVVYDVDSCTQSHLLVPNRMPKPLSSVAVSPDGSFFAAGESGDQPAIVLWEGATTNFLGELKGHQFGVACMAFSPDGKQLASVGYPRDGYVCLWDLHSQMLLKKIKACTSCSAVASVGFLSNAKFIVTAGRKHLKFWTVDLSTRSRANTTRATSVAIHRKPVDLGHQKGHSFVAVTSPNWIDGRQGDHDLGGEFPPIYALTDTGVLYLLSSGLSITNTVDLKVKKGFALSASWRLVACACNSGIVKLFYVDSLAYAGSLYFANGRCNKETTMDCQSRNQNKIQPLPTFPDAIACQFSTSEKLVVIYDDRSLYIWSLHDVNKATRSCVLVSHSACIWDIKNLPCENAYDPSLACVTKGCPGGVSFATCSADGTIRLWDLALQPLLSEDRFSLATYNNSMTSELGATKHLIGAGIFERDSVASGILSSGFRSMAVSSDGKHLAAGDCLGNIHILNLCTHDYLCILDAHDAEILSLNFSLTKKNADVSDKASEGHYLLASGGQDRMIHIFDVERNFDLVGSVDDHSDSVKSVKFTCNGCKIASCGANGSVVLHDVAMKDMECKISRCCQIATHGFIFDMASDPSAEVAVVVGEDKKINIVNIPSGKLGMSLKHDEDLGEPIKVTMDPSCSYLLSSYANGSICMHDYATGKIVAQAAGHGGVITGVIFLPDCKHLASVADDGCIFLWKVPGLLSSRILQRMEKDSRWLPLESIIRPDASSCSEFQQLDDQRYELYHENVPAKGIIKEVQQRQLFQDNGSQMDSAFQFSVSRLPKWAQVKVTTPGSFPVLLNSGFYKQGGEQNLSSSTICVEDNASAGPELQSPSGYEAKDIKQFSSIMSRISSGTDISQGSSSHKQSLGFALDSRWSTIHTVCFDLLNSSEDWEMKDQNLPLSALSNLSKDQRMETTKNVKRVKLSTISPIWDNPSSKSNFGLNKHNEENGYCLHEQELSDCSGTLCDSIDQCWVGNSSLFHKEAVNQVSTKLPSATTERDVLLTVDAGASNMDFQYNYLSKKERRKSSARKSHLGCFVVRMDLGDKKNFQDVFVQDSSSKIPRTKKSTSIAMLEEASVQLLEVLHKAETGQKDEDTAPNPLGTTCNAPTIDSSAVCQAPKSTAKETGKESHVQGYNFDSPEKIIMGCKDALFHLDAAADSALKLFSQLANLSSTEEILQGPEIQLYTEATEMLLPIAKKVNAVTKLVQSANAIPQTVEPKKTFQDSFFAH